MDKCTHLTARYTCRRQKLQSILGHLLNISKCVKLCKNRMIQGLNDYHNANTILLNTKLLTDLPFMALIFMTIYDLDSKDDPIHL